MTLIRTSLTCLLIIFGLAPGPVHAAVDAQARLIPPDNLQAWVGQSVSFDIELLVTGQFSGAPVFELPDAENVVVMQVSNRPLINSRQMNHKTWVSQTHSFAAFSQRGGSVIIPPVTVRFGSKETWNATQQNHSLKTDSLVLSIKMPPGAKGLVAAAENLQASESWQPGEAKEIRVGDAVRRTISLEADNFPAMLLPVAEFEAPQGVSVYGSEPVINDLVDRGTIRANRSDSASFVFERVGHVTLPAISIRWWNPEREEWRVQEFQARSFVVTENTSFASGTGSVESGTQSGRGYLGPLAILITIMVLVIAATQLLRRRNSDQESAKESEATQFSNLCLAVRTQDAAVVYGKSKAWLDRVHAGERVSGAFSKDGQSLKNLLEAVQSDLVGVSVAWDRDSLEQCLLELRNQLNSKQAAGEQVKLLQRLNPSSQA
jgi:hypothetical protein